jgi:hypothetical protein
MNKEEKEKRINQGYRHVPARRSEGQGNSRARDEQSNQASHHSRDEDDRGKRKDEFSKPQSAPWSREISQDDLKKLIKGSFPRDMDDRWMVKTVGPNSRGDYMVKLLRTWTSYPCAAMRVHAEFNDAGRWKERSRPQIVEVYWESNTERWNPTPEASAPEAKSMLKNGLKHLVDVDLK